MTELSFFQGGWVAFFGGLLVFGLLVFAISAQIWLLLRPKRGSSEVNGVGEQQDPGVRGVLWFRALAIFFFMLLKTIGLGFVVYWCLWIAKMPIFWFSVGLISGLSVFVAGFFVRSLLAKNRKYS
jgi:hypothetical protein